MIEDKERNNYITSRTRMRKRNPVGSAISSAGCVSGYLSFSHVHCLSSFVSTDPQRAPDSQRDSHNQLQDPSKPIPLKPDLSHLPHPLNSTFPAPLDHHCPFSLSLMDFESSSDSAIRRSMDAHSLMMGKRDVPRIGGSFGGTLRISEMQTPSHFSSQVL